MVISSFLNTGQEPPVFNRSSRYSPAFTLEAKVSKKEGENVSQTPFSHVLLEMVIMGLEQFCVSKMFVCARIYIKKGTACSFIVL